MAPEARKQPPLSSVCFSPLFIFRMYTQSCVKCNYLGDLEERMPRYIPFELHGELYQIVGEKGWGGDTITLEMEFDVIHYSARLMAID